MTRSGSDGERNKTRTDDPRRTREILRNRDTWLAGQNEAFKAAINGASLQTSLGILISTAIEQIDADSRAAFYIASEDGTQLRHVVGMPEAYARHVNGFRIGPDSLACGLALDIASPIITVDVNEEPRWQPWLWLAKEFNYRGCWSFPVETTGGELVGTFAMYFENPRAPSAHELELAKALTHAAAIIIVQDQTRSQLQLELEDAKRLQALSAELVHEESAEALYEKILDAVIAITHSDCASLQKLRPERGERDALKLLMSRGFDRLAIEHWAWVDVESNTPCGLALRGGARSIIRDIEDLGAAVDADEMAMYRHLGIRGVQMTPLFSRGGQLVGMLSSHWRTPHTPKDRELRLLDILARQAADLLERARTSRKLHANEERLRTLTNVVPALLWQTDSTNAQVTLNPRWLEYTGQTAEETQRDGWLAAVHPDDLPAMRHAFAAALADPQPIELQQRIRRHDGEFRWFLIRHLPMRDAQGQLTAWFGAATDVEDLRQLQNRQQLLVAELQHRTRNLMAVIRSMTRRTVERSGQLSEFETTFLDRLDALARVQRLLSRLGENDRVTFDELIASEIEAMSGEDGRVTLTGPRGIRLRSSSVEPLAMALHELATNAIKYGALGQPQARLAITWAMATPDRVGRACLRIEWRESGVVMRHPHPSHGSGRGRELIEESLPYQADAETHLSLEPDGAHCIITLPIPATN